MKRATAAILSLICAALCFTACTTGGVTVNTGNGHTETAEQTAALSDASQSTAGTPDAVVLSFPERSVTLFEGERIALTAQAVPEDAEIIYFVADPTVFSYENGIVTALSAGSAVLTATASGGAFARCVVVVLTGAQESTEPPATTTPTETPSAETPATTTPTETPSTETPATTTPATETPSTETPSTPERIPVSGISADKSALTLQVGQTDRIEVSVQPANADEKNFTFSVSDPSVISYENGTVTALSPGSAVLTFVSAEGGFSARCTVTVTESESIPNAFRYDGEGLPTYTPTFKDGVEYYDFNPKNTFHLFCHNLVAFEDKDDYFYGDCITVNEFKRILEQLYERDYILIDIDYMYEYSWNNGLLNARIRNSIKLPRGKKAIILSVDNVAYPRSEHGRGRCDRLQVVDGKLVTYTKLPDGSDFYSDDNEVFPILENFIAAHPDFSFSGAKCVVAPSGYEGLFGWDTIPGSENYEQSVAECKKIVKWFNEHGYVFACHSYYHKNFANMTLAEIANDRQHWMDECYPIVGRTHIFIYPFGAFTPKNSDQAKALNEAGYAVFCATSYLAVNWNDFPLAGNCYNERVTLAAKLFAQKAEDPTLAKLFDVYTVYENEAHGVKLYKKD